MDFLVAVSKDERIGLKETGFGVNKQGRERGTARRNWTLYLAAHRVNIYTLPCVCTRKYGVITEFMIHFE